MNTDEKAICEGIDTIVVKRSKMSKLKTCETWVNDLCHSEKQETPFTHVSEWSHCHGG